MDFGFGFGIVSVYELRHIASFCDTQSLCRLSECSTQYHNCLRPYIADRYLDSLEHHNPMHPTSYTAARLQTAITLSDNKLLWLVSCEIDDAVALTLGKSLAHNQCAQILDMAFNQIGDAGAISLAEALKNNQSLQAIDLSHNQIGDEGALVLAETLRNIPTLVSLNLKDNLISERVSLALDAGRCRIHTDLH
jgi:hypothetical protein